MQKATKKTIIMGILNITPDSFSDGGEFYGSVDTAVKRMQNMLNEGADIIDIGGESTRPDAEPVSEDEEIVRIIPVIKTVRQRLSKNIVISVDTYKSSVAKSALESGANMLNCLGGFLFDKDIAYLAAEKRCKVIIYHIKGTPQTMQRDNMQSTHILSDIMSFFEQQITWGKQCGMGDEQFILDPGIGFGKTVEQNIEILQKLYQLNFFNMPIAVGVSRKSHIQWSFSY